MIDLINTDPVLQIIGIVYIVLGFSLFIAADAWREFLEALQKSKLSILLCGCFALLFGLAITMFYQSWEDPGRILLSAVGYVGILEGCILLFFPGPTQQFLASDFYQKLYNHAGFLSIIFGLLFLFL